VPAAAVIPAPIAYIKVVAVKKLVVGLLGVVRLVVDGGNESGLGLCLMGLGMSQATDFLLGFSQAGLTLARLH